MKKLFSIALVIAMAISCLAIFPSATMSSDTAYTLNAEFDGDILTLTASLKGQFTDTTIENAYVDLYFFFDPAELEPAGDKASAVFTNVASGKFAGVQDLESDFFGATIVGSPRDAEGKVDTSISFKFKVLVAPGETITLTDDGSSAGCGRDILYLPAETVFTVPAAAPEYEAPAAAEYQTLAGCELCGTEAGVRFIATVDAAADEFGMYITANGTTVTLSSNDAGFVTKAETADTITFTAVIFSDAKFEVVVFEKYGDTEVKSVAGTN